MNDADGDVGAPRLLVHSFDSKRSSINTEAKAEAARTMPFQGRVCAIAFQAV